ncbi:MAG: hypothetical protein IKR76_00765 [Ruminococcus sp.]|nr:hypothetical protein [Ruminococcus sp.]
MKKPISKRITSFLAAAALAATTIGGSFVKPLQVKADDEIVLSKPVFKFDNSSTNNTEDGANTLRAQINFKDPNGTAVVPESDGSSYYLLVHAKGKNSSYGGYQYRDGETHDHYKLIPIGSGNSVWTSGRFDDGWPPLMPSSGWPQQPGDTMLLEGSIIKSSINYLSVDGIENNSQPYEEVSEVGGFGITDYELKDTDGNGKKDTIVMNASYAYEVTVNVFDFDGTTPDKVDTVNGDRFYVLATIANSSNEIVGWNLKEFDPKNYSSSSVKFTNFYPYGTDGSTMTGDPIRYDSTKHKMSVRVYHSPDALTTYRDVMGTETNPSTASDVISGFKFGREESDTYYHATLTRKIVEYSVDVTCDEDIEIPASKNYYLFVTVQHNSTGETYYLEKVDISGKKSHVFEIQDTENTPWINGDGSDSKERFNDSEKGVIVQLIKAEGDINVNNVLNKTGCAVVAEGSTVNGYVFTTKPETKGQKDDVKDGKNIKVDIYTDHIVLTKATATNDYNFQTILGNSINFGITADRYEQLNHAETNIAVNHYQGNEQYIEPDLSGTFGGHFYIGDFGEFKNEITETTKDNYKSYDMSDYAVPKDDNGYIKIGEKCCRDGMILHTDNGAYRTRTDPRTFIAIQDEDKNTITAVVEDGISHMKAVSADLVTHTANVVPEKLSGYTSIDTSNYPADATLYVDADDIDPNDLGTSGRLHITIKEGQTVVFNFRNTKAVTLEQYIVTVVDEDGNEINTKSSERGSTNVLDGDENNIWLNQYLTRSIVWNLNSVEYAEFSQTAGIFLLPKEDSIAKATATSTGWIVTDGYFANMPSAEWHFVYTGLTAAITGVKVSKADITGQDEVEGAQLAIIDTSTGKAVHSWTSKKDSSGVTNRTFNLVPGTYKLVETGFDTKINSTEYNIIPSEVTFTVEEIKTTAKVYDSDKKEYVDKEVTSAKVVIDETSKENKAAFTEDTENGYFTKVNDNTIRVNDAEKSSDTGLSVEISKVDITSKKEVAGATLQVLDSNGGLVKQWTSTDKPVKITGLSEGIQYTLRETVAPDGYTIAADTVFNVSPNGSVITQGTVTEGGVLLVEDSLTKVKISKVDITDKTEVAGAHIQILDEAGDVVEEWDSEKTAHEITGLKTGVTYTLRETVAPDGYTIASDTTFSIDVHGNVTTSGNKTQDGVLLVEDAKTKVKVSKRDIAGSEELAGATIQILDADNKIADEWVSKSGNIHEIEGLKTGVTYTLHEEVAPDGYTVATDTTFTIDEQGNVTTTGSITRDGILLINDTKTKISVSKVDITTEEEVSGAELKILDKDGTVVREWISAKGAEVIEGLKVNTEYTLRETVAPEGYTIAADTTFTIDKTGKVTSSGTVTEGGVLLVKDALTSVKISKVDVNGQQEVEGAVIQILDKEDNIVDEWTSTKKVHEIKGLKTGEEYTLHETVAPEGYTIATETTFTIDKTGKVTSTGTVTEGGVLLVEDAKTVVKVSKVDIADGKELEGATIQILDEDDNVVDEWTSTKDVHEIEGLKVNTEYTLRETVAPKGYKVATDTTFTIDETGKVTSTGTVTEGGVLLVEDTAINDTTVTISKKSVTDETELEGAELTIFDDKNNEVAKWTSGKTAKEVTLKDGTYTLKETGDEFTFGGKTYKVTESYVTFTVKDGKVTSSTPKSANDGGKASADNDKKVFTISDASTADTVMTISKKEINGKDELEGAELTIFDENGNVVEKWTSGKTAKTVTLKDGTYTLKETGDEFTVGNKTYKVTDSTVEFTVEDGVVTSSKVTDGTIGKITVDGTNITVEDVYEEKKDDDEKKDDEDQKTDDEQKSDDEKKDDEDQKTDDEQKSDDEKKDDEDQKTDDEQKSDDEKKDDEDKKSDDDKTSDDGQNTDDEDDKKDDKSDSDSDSDSADDSNTGSGDANTNDSSTSDGNDNAGEENGSGSASTTGTDNAATGTGTALPAALALACGAVIIFRKKDED